MAKSQMLLSVLQAAFLSACASIVAHHLFNNAADYAANSELFSNWTTALDLNQSAITVGQQLGDRNLTTVPLNGSHNMNVTVSYSKDDHANKTKSFYWNEFPKEMLVILVLAPLQYYWQIWLERTFPARLSIKAFPEKILNDEGNESREEAVIQKWIAQGKVRRASLNWGNTFAKWIIDMSIGTVWSQTVQFLLQEVILKRSLKMFRQNMSWVKWEILIRCAFSYIDIRPLTSLISYIVIPAHKRIVFLAGADLIWATCLGLIIGALVPWLERNEFVRIVLKNMTDGANKAKSARAAPLILNDTRLVDEL